MTPADPARSPAPRVAFAGTPEFARAALASLCDSGFPVVLVLTQPDRPAGRGMKPQAPPVKHEALQRGLQVIQPRSLRLDGKFPVDAAAAGEALRAAAPDVMVVAAYGLILPPWVLDLPRRGCLNIHASLLPRWRGAAPIQRAIEAGDAQTGITLMHMDAGLDTGPMLTADSLTIAGDDTAASLHDRLAAMGARLVVQELPRWVDGTLPAVTQPSVGVTYAAKIDKTEAWIDWTRPAAELERRIRAFDPFPGAQLMLGGETVKVWRAGVLPDRGEPGTVLPGEAHQLVLACGDGALELLVVQRPGGRRMPVREFLRGRPVAAGTRAGASPG